VVRDGFVAGALSSCSRRYLGGALVSAYVDDDLISMKAAAVILNVSWQRVQQLAADGKLAPLAAEGLRHRALFRRADVERLRVDRGVGRYGRV